MTNLLLSLILFPIAAGVGCYVLRMSVARTILVAATAVVVTVSAVALMGQVPSTVVLGDVMGLEWGAIVAVADFALLATVLYFGFKFKNVLVQAFTGTQLVLLAVFEFLILDHDAVTVPIAADNLSLIMVLVISVVGSIICLYGLPYMKRHEAHQNLAKSKQPRFFLFLVLLIGVMNGLVLTNNMLWLYLFFEMTTFCSFILIGHDEKLESPRNALRALWMGSAGGLMLLSGIVWLYVQTGSLDIQNIIATADSSGPMLLAVGLVCIGGFVKAAQIPFQSWLLGAMVAPTPVSALLHSSTMVKAGVYIVLRFAPIYEGTFLGYGIALCGAFTFVACAAMAVGQSNGKKILAYSTISNLGLIIACAGINTPLAMTAAIMLIIFHAVSKALLFLCVGTIEQAIGSKDIEDMRGLYATHPRTALITIIGIVSMLLPPFGVLMSKWMALEAASGNMVLIILLALGSAVSVVYWARWAGILMGSRPSDAAPEKQPLLISAPLMLLCLMAVGFSFLAPPIYSAWVAPMFTQAPFSVHYGMLNSAMGGFMVYPLFIVAGLGLLYIIRRTVKGGGIKESRPYMGGANIGETDFNGPMNVAVPYAAGNYYLGELFGEERLTFWVNAAACALIVLMMGGAL